MIAPPLGEMEPCNGCNLIETEVEAALSSTNVASVIARAGGEVAEMLNRYAVAEMLRIASRSIPRVLQNWKRIARAFCDMKAPTRRGGMKANGSVAGAWRKWITLTSHLMSVGETVNAHANAQVRYWSDGAPISGQTDQ